MLSATGLEEGQSPLGDIPSDRDGRETAQLAEFWDRKVFAFNHDAPRGKSSITPLVRVRVSIESLTLFAFRKIALRLFLGLISLST